MRLTCTKLKRVKCTHLHKENSHLLKKDRFYINIALEKASDSTYSFVSKFRHLSEGNIPILNLFRQPSKGQILTKYFFGPFPNPKFQVWNVADSAAFHRYLSRQSAKRDFWGLPVLHLAIASLCKTIRT